MEKVQSLSRRAMLAGAGGVAGATAFGALGGVANALPAAQVAGLAEPIAADYTPTAVQPGLSYAFYSAWRAFPIDGADPYLNSSSNFRFTTGGEGFASLPIHVPAGSVIREVEFYVNRVAAGTFSCQLWRSTTSGSATSLASSAVPTTVGQHTVTLATNIVVNVSSEVMPFVLINPGTAGSWFGIRVGYTGASQLYLLPAPVRVYDSRPGAGGEGPFLVGVTRTVNCAAGPAPTSTPAVPSGATGALLNVTLDGTVGGGFLQVYSEALGTPPSASSANWYTNGQSQANAVTTAVNASKVKVTCGGNPGSSTNVLVDVIGFYA